MSIELHSELYPDHLSLPLDSGVVPVLILPGLFGMTANWRGFARVLAKQHPVILLDQRNHGRSEHADSNEYIDMVEDLNDFLEHHGIAQIILAGHSMGGKVAMLYSLTHPERVKQLIVMDIAPVKYTHNPAPFLPELLELNISNMQTRAEIERALRTIIEDTATRLFILQSLAGSSGNYYWRTNMAVLQEFMGYLADFPDKLIKNKSYGGPVTLFSGSLSDYVSAAQVNKMQSYYPQLVHRIVVGSGHWIHVEKKNELLAEFEKILN